MAPADKVDRELWRSWRVRSVTRTGSTIRVDLSGGPKGGPGSHLALMAAEHTLNDYLGTDLTVETVSQKDRRKQMVSAFTVRQTAALQTPTVPNALLAGQAYGQETVSRNGSGSRGALCHTSRGGPTGVRPLEVIQAWTSS